MMQSIGRMYVRYVRPKMVYIWYIWKYYSDTKNIKQQLTSRWKPKGTIACCEKGSEGAVLSQEVTQLNCIWLKSNYLNPSLRS